MMRYNEWHKDSRKIDVQKLTGGEQWISKNYVQRDIRLEKFSDRPVEAEKLEKVLEAGHNAPTAHNLQPQRILVMQSKEALEKAEECTACKFHPPVILVVAYDPAKAWNREGDMKNHGEIDATIAATQDDAAGCGLGLGTCYVRHVQPGKAS